MSTKTVGSERDLPPGKHYVIMTFGTIYIPGDERSRTHPGHGYPASTETTINCTTYSTKEEWQEEIQRKTANKWQTNDWIPLIVERPQVKVSVKVDIG